MKAFVTGSTGLLGSNLVFALLDAGHEVKCLVRDLEKAKAVFGEAKVKLVKGDMRSVEEFAASLAGSDVLFHAAAYFREYYQPGRNEQVLRQTNVIGTIRLFLQAERHNVGRIVYVSSSGIVGQRPGGQPGDENTPPGEAITWNRYFYSKLVVDSAIKEFQKEHAIKIVQILPGWMFGPNDRGPTGSGQLVLNYMKCRIYARICGGSNAVDARDVAAAMITAAERPNADGKYLVGGHYVTFDEIMTDLEKITGIPAPRVRLPFAVALVLAEISYIYGSLTNTPVLVTPETVRVMDAELKVDSSKAMSELGVRFRPFIETLRDEVAWFRAHGYV